MNNLSTLNILPVNRTVVFYSPLQGDDVLVRTGTIADGSCFFHAILHAYSKDYISMNNEDRIKYVKKLRVSISKKVDKEKWEQLSDGMIANISFQENVNKILSGFYDYILNDSKECKIKSVRNIVRNIIDDNNKNDTEVYRLICDMLPFNNTFEKNILPTSYKKCKNNSITECKKIIINLSIHFYNKEFKKLLSISTDSISKNKVFLYIKKLEKLLGEVLKEAENVAYLNYVHNLEQSHIPIDSFTIQLISDKFNRDIYFIDSTTKMPYMNASKDNLKKRKSIIIMWTSRCHYEIVGKLLPENKIIREFDYNDSLIKNLYSHLCNKGSSTPFISKKDKEESLSDSDIKEKSKIKKDSKYKEFQSSDSDSDTDVKQKSKIKNDSKYKEFQSSDSDSDTDVKQKSKIKNDSKYKEFQSSDSESENIKVNKHDSDSSSYSD
jgi:hypothetical protein